MSPRCSWSAPRSSRRAGRDADRGLGSPLAAIATLALIQGYAAIAAACAITVGAHAVDVVVGSPLTSLSGLGPNPAAGVRFFGIGNELEAAIAAMVPLGVGAWLGSTSERSPRFAAVAFGVAALVATLAFAPGRFGADVGAAIVLPAGAVVAVALVLGLALRTTLLVLVAVCIGGVVALALIDLTFGGDAHLTRSVLGADGSGELGEVVSRRLRLTARSFYDPAYPVLLVATVIALGVGYRYRDRICGLVRRPGRRPGGFPRRPRRDRGRHARQRLGRRSFDHRHDPAGPRGGVLLGTRLRAGTG